MLISLWEQLGKPARSQFMLALALSAAAGLCGVFLLGLSGWFLTAAALAGMSGASYIFNHLYPSAGVRGAAFGRVGARYFEQLVGHDAILRLSARLRPTLFEKGARSVRGLSAMPTAELSALIDDVEQIEGGFLRIFSPAAAVLAGMVVALGFTFAADMATGFLALLGFAFAAWLVPVHALRIRRERAQAAAEQLANTRESVSRMVENAVELDIIGMLPNMSKNAAEALETHQLMVARSEAPHRMAGFIFAALGGALSILVLWRTGDDGSLALAAGAALSLLAAFDAASALIKAADARFSADWAASRMSQRIAAASPVAEPALENAVALSALFPISAEGLMISPNEAGPAIGPFSFAIAAGEVVEIVGASGSGKTTLAETLMKLQPVAGGALYYGGVAHDSLRIAQILEYSAASPQFPAFLPGDLRSQFHLARPEATDEEIWEALGVAEIDAVIRARAGGLDAPFANGDGGFSGGELRRISLARALLAAPQALILDEPFAGLEPDLIDRLAANLADWTAASDRALIILQHAERALDWRRLSHQVIRLENPSA